MASASSGLGKWLEAQHREAAHRELDADLAAPDLYGLLPFGESLRQSNAEASHALLDADLQAPGSLWHIW